MYEFHLLPRGYGKTMSRVVCRIRAVEYYLQQNPITYSCAFNFIRDEFPGLYDRVMYGEGGVLS